MDFDKIQKCIELFEKCSLKKIVIREKDVELELEKFSSEPNAPVHTHVVEKTPHTEPQPTTQPSSEKKEVSGDFVTSPMVGTFYEAPGPDQPPFVKVGDTVNENTTICIVEAMKVMNEVKAGVKGIVSEILVNNADPVEFGTKLFNIKT